MKLKHIALITTSYPTGESGKEAAGSFVADFAQTLCNFVSVTVIAPGSQNSERRTIRGVREITYRAPRQPLSNLRLFSPTDLLALQITMHNGKRALNKLIQHDKPDHLFALWVLPSGYWAMKTSQRYHIPYSTWALGSDIWTLGKLPIVRRILKCVLSGSKYNFADGIQLRDQVLDISGKECCFLPSTRSFPLQVKKRLSQNPPFRLAYLGRWHPNKGVDLLCDAITRLKESDWRRIEAVRICGGGPMETTIKTRIKRLRAEGRPIEIGGYLSKNEAADLLNWADYLLIPSRIESIPVIFSDALKAKCPVICTPVGDLPRLVVDHQIGFMAKDVSSDSFAVAIAEAIKCRPCEYDSRLVIAAHEFDLDRIIPRFLDLIASVERSECSTA
jgi:glycosyltransferase involved in cell wall biosynthesis